MEECSVSVKKIMAALDLSAYSESTFTHAMELARRFGADLVLVNVVNSRGLDAMDRMAAEGYNISSKSYIETVEKDRQAVFEKDFLSRTGDLTAKLVFKVGLPYEEILKAIKEEGADMLVMGTKGNTDLAGLLFGTTAEKVFRRATCPVVSVRGPEHCRIPEA